jgi:hypothetical protein
MSYSIHDRYDAHPAYPLHTTKTLEEANAWVASMERQYGGYGILIVYGPNDGPSVEIPLSCHCED